jgi:hypothetical protein
MATTRLRISEPSTPLPPKAVNVRNPTVYQGGTPRENT